MRMQSLCRRGNPYTKASTAIKLELNCQELLQSLRHIDGMRVCTNGRRNVIWDGAALFSGPSFIQPDDLGGLAT